MKKPLVVFLVISLLVGVFSFISPIEVLASSTSNNAVTFYNWANSGGRSSSDAYYVVTQDTIKWVTRGTKVSSNAIRYRTIGFQVRATLDNGTVLWTIFPI